jgi:hypothetical protein
MQTFDDTMLNLLLIKPCFNFEALNLHSSLSSQQQVMNSQSTIQPQSSQSSAASPSIVWC